MIWNFIKRRKSFKVIIGFLLWFLWNVLFGWRSFIGGYLKRISMLIFVKCFIIFYFVNVDFSWRKSWDFDSDWRKSF